MKPALFMGRTLEAFVDAVLVPWFSEAGRRAILERIPSAVVIPSHSAAARIRELLSVKGVASIGVMFWTPKDLRVHLAGGEGVVLENASDRELLLRSAAEQVHAKCPINPAAGAIAVSPGSLSETIDLVESGGWGSDVIGGENLLPVLQERTRIYQSCGVSTPAAFSFSHKRSAPLGDILFVGFSASHWQEWGTILAAVRQARSVTVLLISPRRKAELMDMTWIASWESLGGTVQHLVEEPGPNFEIAAHFDELPNVTGIRQAKNSLSFALSRDYREEARAALASACDALNRDAKRVAIIVPVRGALSQEIVKQAESLQIPHYNGVPSLVSDPVRLTTISRLVGFLSEPTAEHLIELCADNLILRAQPSPVSGMRAILEREASNFLFGDASLLAEAMILEGTSTALQVGKFVLQLCVWPNTARVGDYLDSLSCLLLRLGSVLHEEIAHLMESERNFLQVVISRRGMADWLLSKLNDPEPIRSDVGSHRYARLHILHSRDAATLAWDHIVMTGQNDGVWPPPARVCPYLGDDALRSLNEQVCSLNIKAFADTTDSGISPVREGHALCLSPSIHRTLVLRDFANLLENCGTMMLTASSTNPVRPGSPNYLGEIFARLYQLTSGKTIGRNQMDALSPKVTIDTALFPAPLTDGVEMVLKARQARLEADGPCEFEYSLKSSPDWEVSIPCSSWDHVETSPASVFLSSFCGIRPPRNLGEEMAWSKTSGVWVHSWIEKTVGRRPKSINEIGDWIENLKAQSVTFRAKMEALLAKHERRLPAWWTSLWQIADAQSVQFARSLSHVRGYSYVQSEIVVPRTEIQLPDGATLPVHGRVDLAFFDRRPDDDGTFKGASVFVLDFKTGDYRSLKVERIRKGEGVQLPLYSMAFAARGANRVDMGVLRPGDVLVPQLSFEQVKEEDAVWSSFAYRLKSGVFGRLESYRSEFGYAPKFPIACIEPSCGKLRQEAA